MSAGVCGKRAAWAEEIFGSGAAAASSAKRSRCSPVSPFKLPICPHDNLSALLLLFPAMDPKVVEAVLNSHDQNIDDAIKSLHSLCLGDASVSSKIPSSISSPVPEDQSVEAAEYNQIDDAHNNNNQSDPGPESLLDRSCWVDYLVREMTEASDWNDVRTRVSKVLIDFERHISNQSTAPDQMEIALLKEQLQCLLRDNQILKRAVGIQHERNLELEEKSKEVQNLKHMISQYHEQVRALEMNNYTLKIHLQRAQDARSIPNHFNPDIF